MENIFYPMISYLEHINATSVTLRIIMSIICGGLIGAEREKAHRPAGMRTYMLVCLGSAVVMLTGQFMYNSFNDGDPARLGAQVVSGIGFLGAGSIIVSGSTKVKGLTTAAGLWASACIGLAIGIGFYIAGIIATFSVYIIMSFLKKWENHFFLNYNWIEIYVELDYNVSLSDIIKKMKNMDILIEEIHISRQTDSFKRGTMILRTTEKHQKEDIIQFIDNLDAIRYAEYIF